MVRKFPTYLQDYLRGMLRIDLRNATLNKIQSSEWKSNSQPSRLQLSVAIGCLFITERLASGRNQTYNVLLTPTTALNHLIYFNHIFYTPSISYNKDKELKFKKNIFKLNLT